MNVYNACTGSVTAAADEKMRVLSEGLWLTYEGNDRLRDVTTD